MHKLLIKVAKHSRPISIPFGTKRLKQEFSLKIHASQFLVFMLLKTKNNTAFMPKTKHIKFLKAVPEKKLRKDIQTDGVFHRTFRLVQ